MILILLTTLNRILVLCMVDKIMTTAIIIFLILIFTVTLHLYYLSVCDKIYKVKFVRTYIKEKVLY